MMKVKGNKETKVKKSLRIIRKEEIYNKALDLFVKKGYDATSMAMIAKVLGMSKPNLYYYCNNKENLLYQIHFYDLQKRFVPILDEAEQISDPQDRIIFFLKKFTLMCTSSPASRVLIHEIRSLRSGHRKKTILAWARAYELVRGAIKELQESGRARKFRDSFLTFLATGMVFWIVYWFDYGRQANSEELAETLVQVYLNGLLITKNEEN